MSDAVPIITEDTLNTSYGFYPNWVPNADQWNAMFAYKVDAIGGSLTDPVVLGTMTLTQPPGGPNDAANKAYVDNVLGDSNSLPDAPSDGTPYCRMNAGWVPAPTTVTASVTGDLVVPGNLTVGLNATIQGNLQLGATSNGAYQLDCNGPANFMGSGRFVINSTTSWLTLTANPTNVVAPLIGTHLQIVGADGASPRLQLDSYGGSVGAQVTSRAAGGTAAVPTALAANAAMASWNVVGHDGTGYSGAQASFRMLTDDVWSPTSHPVRFQWVTTPVGSVAPSYYMAFVNSGNLLVGALTDYGYRLDVTAGPARFDLASGAGRFPVSMPTPNVVLGASTGAAATLGIASFGTGVVSELQFYGASGGRAAPTALPSAANIGAISGFGYGGTAGFSSSARGQILFVTQEAWSNTAQGTSIAFRTTPNTTILPAEAMRLFGSGNLGIGITTDAGYRLNVVGTAHISGALTVGALTVSSLTVSGLDNTPIGAITPSTGAFTNLSASGTVSGAGFTALLTATLASPGPIGATLPSTGAFTNLSASGTVSGAGFTALLVAAHAAPGPIGSITPSTGAFTNLSASGTVSGAGFAALLASPGPIGSVTPSTGAFTTLSTTGAVQLAGDVMIGSTTDAGYRLDVVGGSTRLAATPTTGPVVIMATGATLPVTFANNSGLALIGNTGIALSIDCFAAQTQFSGRRANGTAAAPTALLNTNPIFAFASAGYGATAYSANYNFIRVLAAENWTDTAQGSLLAFNATPTGTITGAEAMRIQPTGNLTIGKTTDDGVNKLQVAGGVSLTALQVGPPGAAKTATAYTVLATDTALLLAPTGAQTLTLPTATAGRMLWLKLTTAFAVSSAAANVVPQAGGSPTTAIIPATAGKYCLLVADGTNWQLMSSN